jgi:hypothetical protein
MIVAFCPSYILGLDGVCEQLTLLPDGSVCQGELVRAMRQQRGKDNENAFVSLPRPDRNAPAFTLTREFEQVIVSNATDTLDRTVRWNSFVELGERAIALLQRERALLLALFYSTGTNSCLSEDDLKFVTDRLTMYREVGDDLWPSQVAKSISAWCAPQQYGHV